MKQAFRPNEYLAVREPLSSELHLRISETLKLVLQSHPFRTSEQCQNFLRYVVEHSLRGEDESLRERVIGHEVFSRRADYDAAGDPVVRVRAADVRKRLAQFYSSNEALKATAKIQIPLGSYVASFEPLEDSHNLTTAKDIHDDSFSEDIITPVLPPFAIPTAAVQARSPLRPIFWLHLKRYQFLSGLVVLLVCVSSVFAFRFSHGQDDKELLTFWGPVLRNPKPVLICLGSGAVYALAPEYSGRHVPQDENPGMLHEGDRFVSFAQGEKLEPTNLIPKKDIYVSVGEVSANTDLVSMFVHYYKVLDQRYGSDLAFSDLHNNDAVLLGAFNNPWTLSLTGNLRFVFAPNRTIIDRQDGRASWTADEHFNHDYAVVSRIFNPKTGAVLITVAGIGQAGTRAAGEFVTDPARMKELSGRAPKGWARQNLQVVLGTTVQNDTPSEAKILATYFW